jgi:hypothetical protein
MNELLPVLILAIAAVAVWWVVAIPSAVFVVRVREGKPASTAGKVTDAFLATIAEVFHEFNLSQGEIRGVARGERIALWFSAGIPPAACQRLRNWWNLSGWTARSRRCN